MLKLTCKDKIFDIDLKEIGCVDEFCEKLTEKGKIPLEMEIAVKFSLHEFISQRRMRGQTMPSDLTNLQDKLENNALVEIKWNDFISHYESTVKGITCENKVRFTQLSHCQQFRLILLSYNSNNYCNQSDMMI